MVNSGQIKSKIVMIVMAGVFFSILVAVLPTLVANMYGLVSNLSAESTALGTQPASFIGTLNQYFGWFLAIGILGVLITLGISVVSLRRR